MPENPWHDIAVEDYDAHMGHENVRQLAALSAIVKEQLETIPPAMRSKAEIAILGVANGNGLEHILPLGIGKAIGIDINLRFLMACRMRYAVLGKRLVLRQMDLAGETAAAADILRDTDMIIANLLIEHIHLQNFMALIHALPPKKRTISCVIQVNPDGAIASRSGHEQAFADVVSAMEEAEELAITAAMDNSGYVRQQRLVYPLPNGKSFIRLDYSSVEQ